LLESFSLLSQKNRRSTLLLVGEGKLRSRLEKMADQCRDQVVFAGFRDDIPDVMKTMDALVLPSLWEGFGIVLIEAMAAGKPVITTKVSNMPEIVRDGREGYLVPPSDSESLREAMAKLLKHPAQGRKMGRNGFETVRQKFTLKRMVDDTESYFLEQLKSDERI
jgi:glycosyltransferase involved in cell wall biosynthesis